MTPARVASDGVCSGISIRAPQMASEEFLTPVHWRQKFLSIELMASDGVCSGISIRAPQMASEEFLTPVHWRQKFLSIELMAFVVSCGRKETTARWLQAKYLSSGARNRAPLDKCGSLAPCQVLSKKHQATSHNTGWYAT